MSRLKIKDILSTTTEEIRQSRIDKSLLLEWTKQASAYAKARVTRTTNWNIEHNIQTVQKALIKQNKKKTDNVKYRKKSSPYKAEKLDFRIDMNKVNSKQGYAYLLSKFTMIRDFLGTETSTVTGWKKGFNKFRKTLEKENIIDWGKYKGWSSIQSNKKLQNKIFKLYKELNEKNVNWHMLSSTNALKTIVETVGKNKKMSFEKLFDKLNDIGKEKYSEQVNKINTRLIESGADKYDLNGDLV